MYCSLLGVAREPAAVGAGVLTVGAGAAGAGAGAELEEVELEEDELEGADEPWSQPPALASASASGGTTRSALNCTCPSPPLGPGMVSSTVCALKERSG